MNDTERQNLIDIIVKREKLRPLGRLTRLFRDPLRAFPYYLLATASHIKPFKISFKMLWEDTMTGFLPEANTFYYYGYCEANLTSFLLRFLKEGSTFIDVGAHIGFYSMLSSHLVGSGGKVYSFEPTPWTFELLKKNTLGMGNVKIFNLGASDTDGEMSFSDYGPGYGAYNSASTEGTMLTFQPKKIIAKTVGLDSFFKQNNIRPDFIKLDAEGFEYKILNGLSETLRTVRPIITLEMAGDEKWSKNRRISTDILLGAKYEPYCMTDDGFIKSCDIKSSYTYTNILFVPKEKTDLISLLIQ
jgi:FkbM family methyltransferase